MLPLVVLQIVQHLVQCNFCGVKVLCAIVAVAHAAVLEHKDLRPTIQRASLAYTVTFSGNFNCIGKGP